MPITTPTEIKISSKTILPASNGCFDRSDSSSSSTCFNIFFLLFLSELISDKNAFLLFFLLLSSLSDFNFR